MGADREIVFDWRRNWQRPDNLGDWHNRGFLPHYHGTEGVLQFVTMHLDDGLPLSVLERMKQDLDHVAGQLGWVVDEERREDLEYRQILLRKACHKYLDAGHGSCVLGIPECADVVRESLMFHHGSKYQLIAWAIMPNHIHVVIEILRNHTLGEIQKTFKRHTTREIKRIIAQQTALRFSCPEKARTLVTAGRRIWQREAWDRFIRNGEHLQQTIDYILANPVKAGLVDDASEWPWCGVWVDSFN